MPAVMTLGLQATADAGYTFAGWSGSCSGTSPTTSIQLGGARTCAATFVAAGTAAYQLSIDTPAHGTVTGGGITCGTGGTTCSASYAGVTAVTLTAAADTGYAFSAWGGSCSGTGTTTTVSVDGVRTCTAAFTLSTVNGPPYTMTISPRPTGGTVTGAGLNCGSAGAACSVTMPAAMTLGLQATADAGYTFSGWSGHCSGSNPGLYIQLAGARTCGATFTPR
jgi:uncharacterized repeat protein (TIGR02543 family)